MSKYKDKETLRAEKYMKISELSDDMNIRTVFARALKQEIQGI